MRTQNDLAFNLFVTLKALQNQRNLFNNCIIKRYFWFF